MQTRFIKKKESAKRVLVWRAQAIFFGWLKIYRTFINKQDAIAWYDRYQKGFRYRNAIAVIFQGYTKRTPKRFLKEAMLGGDELRLVKNYKCIRSQADCDYILYSNDYENVAQ